MSFVIELGEVYKYAQNEPEVRRAHGLAKGDWEDVVNHLSQFFGQEVTDEQARKLLRIQPDNIVQFGADDRRDLLANHKVTDWGPLDPYALYQFLPQQNRVHQHTISVETHAPEGDSNATNPHNYSHLYLYVGDDGRPHMYGNYLCRPKGSKHPNGTQQMADMLDTAHQLGVSKVHMRAYSDLPNFVGSLVWPKMGFNDEIPEAAKRRLPDHLKTATDMHTLLGSTGGKQFWDDHVKAQPHRGAYDWSTLEHAVFDMDDPVAHDMLDEHKKLMYTKKQAPKPQTGTGNAPTTYSCRNSPHTGLPEGKSHSDDRRGNGNGRRQSPAEGTSGEVHTGDAFGQAFAEVLIRYSVEPTHADFHKAIHNEPEAMHHHLVYADWLQEQGMDKEADLIRKAATNGYAGVRSGIHTLNLTDAGQFADGGQYKGSVPTGRTTLHALFTRSAVDPDVALGWHAPVAPIEEWDAPEDYSSKDEVFRYSAVPANDIHPDYQHTGVAPRVGNALQQIAAQDSDAGLLAEGILRTGDHSVLKFLADKLDDDGHPLKDAFDWRHVERGINIDKALHKALSQTTVATVYGERPLHPMWALDHWGTKRKRPPLSRSKALRQVREKVPDANNDDLHHSVMRLIDADFVRSDVANADPALQLTPYQVVGDLPDYMREIAKAKLKNMVLPVADPHMYPDTRPLNKRYQLEALKEKYNAYKGPAGGMVVKESPFAVVGQWVQGGQFTKDLSKPTVQPTAKNKLIIEELIRKWRATLQKKVRYSADMDTVKNLLQQLASNPDHQQVGSNHRFVTAGALEENGDEVSAQQLVSDRPVVGYTHNYGQNLYVVHPSGTAYTLGTHPDVIDALEKARQSGQRVHISYGHTTGDKAGVDWLEENGNTGTVSRSTGSIKIPVMSSGDPVSTHKVVRIRSTKDGKVLYQHPEYTHRDIKLVKSDHPDYSINATVDGETHARFRTVDNALKWVKKLGIKLTPS